MYFSSGLEQGQQTFYVKEWKINILGPDGCMSSIRSP